MNSVLNFSKAEKNQVLGFLKLHEPLGEKSEFEEFRCKILDCNVILYKSGKLLIQGKSAEIVKKEILQNVKTENELILGIDETGRGENYGPLIVAGVLGETKHLRELRDSKKTAKVSLSGKAMLVKAEAKWFFIEVKAAEIDSLRELGKNLNTIEANAINKIIEYFENKEKRKFRIVIDGSPIKGVDKKAEFLPKADDLVPQVSAASIIAKYCREQSSDKEKRKTWKAKN